MNVMVPIPDELAARFGSEAELGRRAVEVLALEEYRAGRMARAALQKLLGFADAPELDGFLRAHGLREATALHTESEEDRRAAAADLVERFKVFRVGKSLGGLDIKDLITEGRR